MQFFIAICKSLYCETIQYRITVAIKL